MGIINAVEAEAHCLEVSATCEDARTPAVSPVLFLHSVITGLQSALTKPLHDNIDSDMNHVETVCKIIFVTKSGQKRKLINPL